MNNLPSPRIAAPIGGFIHLIIFGGLYLLLFGNQLIDFGGGFWDVVWSLNIIFGAIMLGAIPTYLLVKYELVAPIPVIIIIALITITSSPIGGNISGPPDFAFYFIFWFVPLGLSIIIGVFEYYFLGNIGSS